VGEKGLPKASSPRSPCLKLWVKNWGTTSLAGGEGAGVTDIEKPKIKKEQKKKEDGSPRRIVKKARKRSRYLPEIH